MTTREGGPCGGSGKDLKVSKLSGRSNTRQYRQFDQFGLKIGESVTSCGVVQKGLTSLASKPGVSHAMWGVLGDLGLKITGGGFHGLGLKTKRE